MHQKTYMNFPELLRQATKLHHHLLNPYHTWASTALGFFLKNPENSVPSRKILTLHQKKALKEQLFTKIVPADLLE